MFHKNQTITIKGVILIYILNSYWVFGLPQGGAVIDGQATIESNNNYMQINQSSNSAILNWQSFNIGAGEHTHFQQPSSSAITINRINGANGSSTISGTLTATGQIFLLNPSGILFTPNSQINVGSILASTSDINIEAYMQGRIELLPHTVNKGSIINQGNITVSDGGYVAFAAPLIANHGVINANLGHVQLASGEYFTVDLFGDGLIHLKVPEDQLSTAAQNYRIEHRGEIYANGGRILISAAAADHIVSSIISMDGLLQANSIADANGKIVLSANSNGTLEFTSNSKIHADGGEVKALAKDIKLATNSLIDVSSVNDLMLAGSVYIGGNLQGSLSTSEDFNAQNVIMEKDASILANAFNNGNGGTIVLWSDNFAQVAGNLYAKSGKISGNGGLIETSGKYNLDIKSDLNVNTASLNNTGRAGTWLIDPILLIINSDLANSINTALLNNNVTLTTNSSPPLIGGDVITDPSSYHPNLNSGDIVFLNVIGESDDTPISWNNTNKLSIIAADDILFGLPGLGGTETANKPITGSVIISTGGGDIHLQTNADGTLPTYGDHSTFGSFYDFFYQNDSYTSLFLPIENTVVSSGGGLVELYSDHNPINYENTNLNLTDIEVINALTDSNYNGFVSVSNGSQLIDYQLIYNEVSNRTIHDINPALFYSQSNNDKSFALNQNITVGNFTGIGNNTTPFTGSFDGLGYTIFNLVINNNNNAGLFNETNSNNIATKYPDGSQYFKNIVFDNPQINAELSTNTLDDVNVGVLIGKATITNEAALKINNITIQTAYVSSTISTPDHNPTHSKVGGLIGATVFDDNSGTIINNSSISLGNIIINNSYIDSSYIAAGLIGENNATFVNLLDNINITESNITANLNIFIANDNTNGFASTFAAGLIGNNINTETELHSNKNLINISQTGIIATNELASQNAYAGGLIANFVGSKLVFDKIIINESNIFAQISRETNPPNLSNVSGNEAFAGGLIGNASNNNLHLEFNDSIQIMSDINAIIDVPNEQGRYQAYAGGLYGQLLFENAIYNNEIHITQPNSAIRSEIIANQASANSHAYAGGLVGKENLGQAIYNSNILTNGAVAINNQATPSNGLYAASMAGGLVGYSTANSTFNGSEIIINNNSSEGINAISNGNQAIAYAGGLYGFLNGTPGSSFISINSDIQINAPVRASTFGNAIDNTEISQKNIMSGGLFGLSFGNNVTIASTIEINSPITSNSAHAPLQLALQAAGGIFGGLVNSNFVFTETLFNFHNTNYVTNNNVSATGYTGEVIGYVNVQELNPFGNITYGAISKDVPNEGANWDNDQGNFHYTGSNQPCQGPSAGLCLATASIGDPPPSSPPPSPPPPTTATEVFQNLPEHVIHIIETHTSTTSHAHEGETHSHAPHVPHNDHRSHHNEESEFTATFTNADYKDLIIHLGYPSSTFSVNDNNLFFVAFEFEGHHGFSLYEKDIHGDFSRPNSGEAHH
jgi:filamentous hemagglutinin family protein